MTQRIGLFAQSTSAGRGVDEGCGHFQARSTELDVYTAASSGFSLHLLVLKGSFFTHTNAEPV